jgi:NADH dehydrogenase
MEMRELLIVGGGFAGVWAALAAAKTLASRTSRPADVRITLMSRDPWLTIRPRLYEASLDEVRVPLESVLEPVGVRRLEGEVTRVDVSTRTVTFEGAAGPQTLGYDRMILAAGSYVYRAPIPGIDYALSVDTYRDAVRLDAHLSALPRSATGADDASRFTAVVIGGGLTGIETATVLISRLRALAQSAGDRDRARVVLVDRASGIASGLGEAARGNVEAALRSLRIESRVGQSVAEIRPEGVTLSSGEWIPARTAVWTGGFRASRLATQLQVELDSTGRVPVDALLRVRGMSGVFAAGDVARAMADEAHVAPMSCQHAIPMGERAGENAALELLGMVGTPYAAPNYVTCLDLGEAGALFMEGWKHDVRLSGYWAKLMKETINTRLIYPPLPRTTTETAEKLRPRSSDGMRSLSSTTRDS